MAQATSQAVTLDIVDEGVNRKKVTVHVAPAKVDEVLSAVIREFAQRASLPGFRPGKAPEAVVLRKYQGDIMQEAQKRLSELSFQTFQEESKLNLLGRISLDPAVRPVIEKGKEFTYAFSTDIQPPLNLIEVGTVEIEQEELTIYDEEIDHRIGMAAKRAGEHQELKEGAVVADDQILVDTRVLVDGQEVNKTEGDFWQIHGDHLHGSFVGTPKSTDVIGKKVGEPFTYTAKLPKDFKVETAREKDATVEVTVKTVHRTIPAKLDDDLAKKFGFENVDKLKEMVRQSVLNEVEQEIHQKTLDKLTDELIKKIEFPVPEKTFENAKRMFLRDFLRHYRLTPEALEQPGNEKLKEVAREVSEKQAERSIRTSLIVGEYADKFKIEVTPEEFNNEIEGLAQRNQMDVKKFLKKVDQSYLMEAEHNLRTQKTLEYLLSLAKVKMVERKKPDMTEHDHHHHHDHDEHDHDDEGEAGHEGHDHAHGEEGHSHT